MSDLLRGRAGAAAVALLVVAVAAAAGLLAGARIASEGAGTRAPADSSVDAGFARDMQVHHAQAVQMSMLVRENTDDQEVRALALDVLLTQQQQIGQMYGWLASWGLSQVSDRPPMAWMHDGADDQMSGMAGMGTSSPGMPAMASQEQLEQLERAQGPDAAVVYLQLLVPHHQGAVEMARAAATSAHEPQVRRLAQSITDSQLSEIAVLEQMLARRGASALPA